MARMTTSPALRDLPWSATEKKVARRAFEQAYRKQCDAIRSQLQKMIAKGSEPPDIWAIHDYLSKERKRTDEIFDRRYSVMIEVLSILLRQGWVKKSDLAGLSPDKIEKIQHLANLH